MSGFKNFIMRGNLVDLAVAVVIGTQFSNLVKQFVQSFVDPLLSLGGGKTSFGDLTFTVRHATFAYGAFLTDVLSFLISALVVYYILVLPHGGQHHGYFLPAEGASDRALALFSFPSLARYESYRELFGVDPEFIAADRIRDESGCVLRSDLREPGPGRL
jgi:large conductance mechanosensitive channel protein